MDDQLILKNRLKVARAEKGLSQTQLAEMVGVSRNTISSIETGQFNPTAKLALVLCIALVMAAECVNTAVEAAVDLVSPGYHELAKRAKDCAAAAVLLCAAGSVVVGALVFAGPVLALL